MGQLDTLLGKTSNKTSVASGSGKLDSLMSKKITVSSPKPRATVQPKPTVKPSPIQQFQAKVKTLITPKKQINAIGQRKPNIPQKPSEKAQRVVNFAIDTLLSNTKKSVQNFTDTPRRMREVQTLARKDPRQAQALVQKYVDNDRNQNRKTALEISSFLVPVGKAGFVGSKFIAPGALAGSLQGMADDVDLKTMALYIGTGAVGGAGLQVIGRIAKKTIAQIAVRLKKGDNTLEDVVNAVVGSGTEKTAEGKKIVKAALDAEKKGEKVKVVVQAPEDFTPKLTTELKPRTVKNTDELITYINKQGFRTPEQVNKLRADIKKNGIKYPVELIEEADGTFTINDGTHRIQIAKDLGIKEVPVKVVKSKKVANAGTKAEVKSLFQNEYMNQARKNVYKKFGVIDEQDFKNFEQGLSPEQKRAWQEVVKEDYGLSQKSSAPQSGLSDVKIAQEVSRLKQQEAKLLQSSNISMVPSNEASFRQQAIRNLTNKQSQLVQEADKAKSLKALKALPEKDFVDQSAVKQKLYHGTPNEFDEFSMVNAGKNTGTIDAGEAIWFTDSVDDAKYWAGYSKTGKPKVVEANVHMKNPMVVSGDEVGGQNGMLGIIDNAINEGHDGLIIDKGNYKWYAVFTPEQTRIAKSVAKQPIVDVPKAKTVKVPREQLPVKSKEGVEKVSRLEARVTASLDKTPQEIKDQLGSTYTQMNKREQISKAVKYVNDNPDEAMAVLRGEKEAPKDILKNSIYVAMENQAKEDVELARRLASLQSTRAGQELSILTEIDPNSPVKIMRDLINVKEEAFKLRYKNQASADVQKKVVADIQKRVKTPDKYDWNNFIESIQC